jgi:hypothetical protein
VVIQIIPLRGFVREVNEPFRYADERIIVPGKSPQKHNSKKSGKSLKEKRADKKAKKDHKDQQSATEIAVFRTPR